MIDLKLEKQFSDIKELLGLWKKFHEFFVIGVKSTEVMPENEQQFLRLKSRIAMLSDAFLEALTHDHNIGQNVISLVERSITLQHLSKLSVAEVKKMEIEWHEAYLLLNEVVGILEDRKEELGKVSPSKYRIKKMSKSAIHGARVFFTSGYFKILIGIAVIIFILWALPALNILDYSQLKEYKYTKPIYKALVKTYRKTFNAELPYDSIDDLELDDSKRADNNVEDQGEAQNVTLQQSAMQYFQMNLHDALRSCQEFEAREFRYKGQQVRILLFRYNNIIDADNVVAQFNDWKQGHRDELDYPSNIIVKMTTAFNKLNIVVFILSPSEEARNYFKEVEFGVYD